MVEVKRNGTQGNPPMIRIVESFSAARRLEAAKDFLARFLPATELLIIGSTRQAADDLARRLSIAPKATFGVHRFSLTQLASRLATVELATQGLTPCSSLGAQAVAARTTFEALSKGRLDYFSPVATLPGFSRRLASTISELRDAHVHPNALAALTSSGRDLAALLELFQEHLSKAGGVDHSALYQMAIKAIRARKKDHLLSLPMLFIDVPIQPGVEQEFFSALVSGTPDALFTLPREDDMTRRILENLSKIESLDGRKLGDISALGRLGHYLFSEEEPPKKERDQQIVLFSAPGEGRECVEIARRILQEAGRGMSFDDMAILLRAPATYASFLETALRRAEIPAYFDITTQRPDPAGRAFLALLRCAQEGLSARRFAEYLSLAQVPVPDQATPSAEIDSWAAPRDETMGPVANRNLERREEETASDDMAEDSDDRPIIAGKLRTPWRWEEFLIEASIIGSKDRWARRLAGLEVELLLKQERLAKEQPDSPRLHALEGQLRNLRHLRSFALPVVEFLANLPARDAWKTWLERLRALASLAVHDPGRILSALADMEPMAGIAAVSLDEVVVVLSDRLSTLESDPPRYRYGRVFVSTPERVRGHCFKVVFVPGLAERIFPERPREDPILSDALREQLAPSLETQSQRVARERLRLKLAVGAANERIYISYPRVDVAQGRPRVPSFYALDIERAISGHLPNVQLLEESAEQSGGARLAWPAPAEAAQAIDAAEHDLAVLGPLLRKATPRQATGRARYLFELNNHLGRSLRTRWARWNQKNWSNYDGLCRSTPAVKAALDDHRLQKKPLSASMLQKYAVCPYQFFLAGIHRLEAREEIAPLQEMDPLTRGSFFHRVQTDVMRRLMEAGCLPVTPTNLERGQQMLDETVDEVALEYSENLVPAIPRVWQDEVEKVRVDLRVWLRRMAEASTDWEPIYFEFGFGLPPGEGRDPHTVAEPAVLPGRYQLHGVVDLIEQRDTGKELRVTDHKTGKDQTKGGLVVGGGQVLQPTLYGLAVESTLQKQVVEGRLYHCTCTGGFADRIVPLNDVARRKATDVLRIIDNSIKEGFFLPAPLEKACTWCDFLEVCGPYEQIRAGRKATAPLAKLEELRKMP